MHTTPPHDPPQASSRLTLAALPPRAARLCLAVAGFLTGPCGHDPAGATWIVALSGGPDSVALLAMAAVLAPRLGLARLEAAHLDHGLRPESAAEAQSVLALCRRLGVPGHSRRVDVAALAREGRTGLEDAGRQARYAFFAELAAGRPNAWTLTGHQLNDLAEDQLLRLTRGAGWPALGGMAAADPARRLLRPLLLTPKSALETFLAALTLPTLCDPSNSDPAFARNRVRQTLLPAMVAENPRDLETAARLWRQARLDADFFETSLPRLPDPTTISRKVLAATHPASRLRLYRRALAALGPGQALADGLFALDAAVTRRATGRVFQFPGGKTARLTSRDAVFSRQPAGRAKQETALTALAGGGNEADCEKSNMEAVPVNILTFGPNGSGKGTQGSLVKKKYNLAHIESGAIFREHIGGGTELGMKAKAFIDKGELVPDDITIPMILETLKAKGGNGWLLDGFPRNMVQAEKLWEALQKEGMKLDYVIEILLPREIAKNRIMGRRLCANDPNHPNNIFIDAIKPNGDVCRVCGGALKSRSDDQDEAAIGKRHDIYYDTTTGTLAAAYFYKDLAAKGLTKYIELNGEGSIDSIKETLLAQLD
jgi:tRNA(Ile)-lysidine synthetase-like protein